MTASRPTQKIRRGSEAQTFISHAYHAHPDELQHLRYTQVAEQGPEALTIAYAPRATAMMVGGDNLWSVALLGADKHHKAGVNALAEQLPEGSLVTASEPLISKLAQVWSLLTEKPAQLIEQSAYFTRGSKSLLRPLHSMPFVTASELGEQRAAEEMAFVWLSVKHQPASVADFKQILASSDALLWRPKQPAESFHLFTQLSKSHIMLGGSCGQDAHLPYLFSQLAQRDGNVAALVDCENHTQIDRLKAAGFIQPSNLTFATYKLG